MMNTRGVWAFNKTEELNKIEECLNTCCFIAIDTEFPGCLIQTPMQANEEERHRLMQSNVDKTKLIQLGFTLFDATGNIGGTWEVNFSDFDVRSDAKNPKSIEFLKKNGLDFDKIREEGVGIDEFFKEFSRILNEKENQMTWVTFDGSYDLGYLLKGLSRGDSIPETLKGFNEVVERFLGNVHDVKKMSALCEGLSSRFGLQRIANEFQFKRVGEAHHAGSDSELTARVFLKMVLVLSDQRRRFDYDWSEQLERANERKEYIRSRVEAQRHLRHMEQLERANERKEYIRSRVEAQRHLRRMEQLMVYEDCKANAYVQQQEYLPEPELEQRMIGYHYCGKYVEVPEDKVHLIPYGYGM